MKKKANAASERVLLLKTNDGEKKVTLPSDAKITFGPAIPYEKKNGGYGSKPEYALRIYRGTKDNLIAVFAGVREFREISMPVATLVIREAGKSVWKSDEQGFSVSHDVKKAGAFVPDDRLLAQLSEDSE